MTILVRVFHWWRFWLLWVVSCGLNVLILMTVRQFYYTDDIYSEYFKSVSGVIDNWVAIAGGFVCLLLIYMISGFYKDKAVIVMRFSFVTAIQFLLLGLLRLASAPFALKYNSRFQLTPWYIWFSIGLIVLSVVLFSQVAHKSGESLWVMIKRLLRLHREDKYW